MSEDNKVVAILRYNRMFCRKCLTDAAEREAWDFPHLAKKIMSQFSIGLVRENDLKGGERCAICSDKLRPV
jgi:hypothetical protein